MNQGWPLLHRRMASVTALRCSGLPGLSAAGRQEDGLTIMSVPPAPCVHVASRGAKASCGFRPFLGLQYYYSLSRARHLWTPASWKPSSQNSRSLSRSGCVAPSHDEASLDGVALSYTEEAVSISSGSADKKAEYRRRSSVSEAEAKPDPTIIVFDIETTGFLRSGSKIVELACRDLAGGDCSTLETLVNPSQPVPPASTNVHNITSEMVNRDDIPSWTEVMTAFVDFVESRRKGADSDVILVAHNGRRFDVPFIIKECYECYMTIPSHWYFVDTIDLAKAMLKKRFGKAKLYKLQYLYYDCYNLPQLGDAHRAGVDVDMLARVFGKLLMDLEMPVSELLHQAFKASDIELKPDLLIRDNSYSYGRSGFGMPKLESTT